MENIERIVLILQRIKGSYMLEKMKVLKRKYQQLEGKKEDIKQELTNETESSSRKRPKKEVQNWIENVQSIKNDLEKLEEELSRSNIFNRLLVENKVESLTREVTELTEQSKFERGPTLESNDNGRLALVTKRLVGKTFAENKKKILGRLMGGEDSIVGVYGMGGVGKTTLITHIHNQLLRRPGISVHWVTVSQNFNIRRLQGDIAKRVGSNLSEEDDERIRAAKLARDLKRREKYVLFLDDVWDTIRLNEVGIPDDALGGRLVLTTRSLEVCQRMMCRNPIKVEPLSHKEGWTLFMETLGNEIPLTPCIEKVAKSLVEECGRLPLAIITLGASMRGVGDICEWRDALKQIQGGELRDDDMDFKHVFSVLEYSYQKLKDADVQKCFLYCSLFPEDAEIERDRLINYFIDEGLIERMSSRQSQFDRGHRILNKLQNICLLEGLQNYNGVKCVKMHDLVRDMAIKIASCSPYPFLVQAGLRLENIPNEGNWSDDLVRVSLMRNRISMIPSNASPRCPRLLTLLLCNNGFKVIPYNFFVHMKMLTVLDLSDTYVESLPTSIANLEGLAALLLRGCTELRYVPSLENLTALRRLDLCSTAIKEVPKGMEKLKNLRHLNLEKCRELHMIPVGILPELSRIEWFRSCDSIRLRGQEIGCLRKLENFYGIFHHIGELESCVRSWEEREPNKYTIYVIDDNNEIDEDFDEGQDKKCVLAYDNAEDTFVMPLGTQFLHLECCSGMTSLSHNATMGKVTDLKTCYIFSCDSMQHVICSCCNIPFSQTLEKLTLCGLPMLSDLVEKNTRSSYLSTTSVIPNNTFSSLKDLSILECDGLKSLFTPSLLSALRSLQKLYVADCEELVEIVGDEEATPTILCTPPNLKYLSLVGLPKLKSFCSSSIKLIDSLQRIRIRECPKLKRMTLLWEDPHPPASLGAVTVEKEWWDLVEWKHPHTKDVLQRFLLIY